MTKERNAFKAGIFIIFSICLIVGIIVGIKGVGRFLDPMQQGMVVFKLSDDIGGLSTGDEVRVGGAKVGVVRDVDFGEQPDGNKVINVSYSIPKRFILHKDAIVSIQSTVTGVSVLNFSGLGTGELLAEGDTLPGRPGALTSLLESGPDIVGLVRDVRNVTVPKVNNAIDRTTETVAVYKGTGESATDLIKYLRGKIDPIIERYNTVADSAKSALDNVGSLFGDTKTDFRTTVANLRDATGTVKEKLPSIMDRVDTVVTKVATAIDDASGALQDVKKITANTRDATATVRQIIINNRGKIESMIASLKTTGDNLKNATAEVRRSPWRLLYKPSADEMANLNLYDSARQFSDGAQAMSDAAIALRDALRDPDVDPAHVQKLVEKLDSSFTNFDAVEKELWTQVKP